MCRLYGFRANEPTKVECTLVYAQNALLSQSRADLRGTSHPDGWGIGYFENADPKIERRETAAHRDLHFSVTAERIYAKTVLAHVRRATVGGAAVANTHPFAWGRWVFAHNGTVQAFQRLAPILERETAPRLLRHRLGTTDSELVFYWLLSRMEAAGGALLSTGQCNSVMEIVSEAIRSLDARCNAEGSTNPAQLNFIMTNGRMLVASRWRNSLYWVQRYGVHDCEICGIPHIRHTSGTDYRAVVVASEPLSDEAWQEVPEGGMLCVDPGLRVVNRRIRP